MLRLNLNYKAHNNIKYFNNLLWLGFNSYANDIGH